MVGLRLSGDPADPPVILDVAPGSAADRAGLLAGDVILQVNRTRVTSLETYRRAMAPARKGETVLLRINRRDRALFVTLRPR